MWKNSWHNLGKCCEENVTCWVYCQLNVIKNFKKSSTSWINHKSLIYECLISIFKCVRIMSLRLFSGILRYYFFFCWIFVRKYLVKCMHNAIILTKPSRLKLAFYKHFTRKVYCLSICTIYLQRRSGLCHVFVKCRYEDTETGQFL